MYSEQMINAIQNQDLEAANAAFNAALQHDSDDELADLYLTRMDDDDVGYRWCHDGDGNESTSMISDGELWDALERIVLNEKSGALVVLCGAALR